MKNCKYLLIVLGTLVTSAAVAEEVIRQEPDNYRESIVEHHRGHPQKTKHIYYTTQEEDWRPERYRYYNNDWRDHYYHDHDRRLGDSRIFPWNW